MGRRAPGRVRARVLEEVRSSSGRSSRGEGSVLGGEFRRPPAGPRRQEHIRALKGPLAPAARLRDHWAGACMRGRGHGTGHHRMVEAETRAQREGTGDGRGSGETENVELRGLPARMWGMRKQDRNQDGSRGWIYLSFWWMKRSKTKIFHFYFFLFSFLKNLLALFQSYRTPSAKTEKAEKRYDVARSSGLTMEVSPMVTSCKTTYNHNQETDMATVH
ncbi:uncharacterized protein LOC116762674 isoform X2 [Phocoena sinus]|uniref:uncharacterized protein LOC116762674 isoform X2 n=1 Tax=Phocoena sinus TaxID=42100 RepID=UPI0013C505BF|nr:uncharacterized protein LOC116762674 isoform X2 [Phocoena sinus]